MFLPRVSPLTKGWCIIIQHSKVWLTQRTTRNREIHKHKHTLKVYMIFTLSYFTFKHTLTYYNHTYMCVFIFRKGSASGGGSALKWSVSGFYNPFQNESHRMYLPPGDGCRFTSSQIKAVQELLISCRCTLNHTQPPTTTRCSYLTMVRSSVDLASLWKVMMMLDGGKSGRHTLLRHLQQSGQNGVKSVKNKYTVKIGVKDSRYDEWKNTHILIEYYAYSSI